MILIQVLGIFLPIIFLYTFIIPKSGILYYHSYYSKIDGSLSSGCIVMTLKLFVNIVQSFLSIFQQGSITAKYNLLHMIKSVCFKDNCTGRQTHEKEATSVFYFPVKAFVSVFGFGGLLCSHKTHRCGQEAISLCFQCPEINRQHLEQ